MLLIESLIALKILIKMFYRSDSKNVFSVQLTFMSIIKTYICRIIISEAILLSLPVLLQKSHCVIMKQLAADYRKPSSNWLSGKVVTVNRKSLSKAPNKF